MATIEHQSVGCVPDFEGVEQGFQTRPGRRAGERIAAELPVILFKGGAPLGVGTARDASAAGMFVSLAIPLPHDPLRGDRFEVGFGVECGGITRNYRLVARIARIDAAGVGLVFEEGPDPVARIAGRMDARHSAAARAALREAIVRGQ